MSISRFDAPCIAPKRAALQERAIVVGNTKLRDFHLALEGVHLLSRLGIQLCTFNAQILIWLRHQKALPGAAQTSHDAPNHE